MAALCRAFGISRECGYKWLRRYHEAGPEGLQDRSRAPEHRPQTTPKNVRDLLRQTRERHPNWGPRTLIARLQRKYPKMPMPAASTVGELLKRAGLVPRHFHKPKVTGPVPCVAAQQPNDVWCADFKGHFPTSDGRRCHPLTISDAHTRYLLRCDALASTHEAPVHSIFEHVFREYGLPKAIRTDNGSPFSGTGGLSKLSVWWVKLGIHLERIPPAKPYRNGRHERMHRTLKEDVGPGPRSMTEHQRSFDRFRDDYNHDRPHQALAMATPGSLYRPSRRQMPRKLEPIEYGPGWEVRSVRANGTMKWQGRRIHLSDSLGGERVGLYALDDGLWAIHFGPLRLAVIDDRRNSVYRGS